MRDFQQTLQELKGKIYRKVAPLEAVCGVTSEPVPYADREKLVFRSIGIGEKWGNLWDCAWFRFTGELPSSCSLRDAALRIDLSGEGLLYGEDGVPLRGITNVDSEFDRTHGYPGKRVVPFAELGLGRKVDVWADCGCNDLFGKDCGGVLLQAEIVVCDHALRRLYYDATVLENLAASEGEEGLSRLDELFAAIARGEYAAAQSVASALLAQRGGAEKVFTACGHAHLDLAWLWPLRETKRKAERTFATALRMMERYPAYIAGFSQPQQFEWVKEHAPALYEQIRARVAEGRLEPQGALWVEPDTNVTGGESLVRQCMYGRAFFGREFGKMPTVAHLPDCFGFSAALPQIFSQCGVDKMVTIKLSWNRYNRFPHTTFRWKGIDGSEILVHMPPEGTYNSAASPAALRRACENDREAGRVKNALLLYGIGDGGGGPGPEHIERLLREADLKGLPRVEFGTEEGFFGKLAAEHPPLKSYRGDLYLEKHQGTYTTRFYNKRHNRIMERLLADAEYLLCCAHVREGAAYPRAALERLWKETLLYQFHDILPGSSIKRVYDECEVRYPMLEAELTELAETALPEAGERGYCLLPPSKKYRGGQILAESGGFRFSADGWSALLSADGSVAFGEGMRERGNVWALYEDGGDGWDYADGYKDRRLGAFRLVSARQGESGVSLRFAFGDSSIEQFVCIGREGKTLRFETVIDWREKDRLLADEFTVPQGIGDITCGVQFGAFRRTLRRDDPVSAAMTEFCAQRFVDLSDARGGYSLLNDGVFGYSADDGMLRMHVLRNAPSPGTYVDTGVHRFVYEIYPHGGEFSCCETPYLAERLNAREWTRLPAPLFRVHGKAIVSCIKLSEDGTSVVLRLYEPSGRRVHVRAEAEFPFRGIAAARADETELCEIPRAECVLRPFEIKTFLFKL